MPRFKFHVLDHQYNIMTFDKIECRYDELLQKAKIYLDEYAKEGYGSSMQLHVSGMWPDGYKLFFILFP